MIPSPVDDFTQVRRIEDFPGGVGGGIEKYQVDIIRVDALFVEFPWGVAAHGGGTGQQDPHLVGGVGDFRDDDGAAAA